MKILNLADQSKSDIKYRIDSFPDGQKNITILGIDKDWYPLGTEMTIKSRLNNFQDLEIIICSTKALKPLVDKIHLYTPYFLGSRSDRLFEVGSTNYLKDVICPIINSLKFSSVTILDPHSHVLEACLANFKSERNAYFVNWAYNQIYGIYEKDLKEGFNKSILVSPDAGATHKIYKLAEQIGYKGDIITCSKERDFEGKLTKCIVPFKAENVGKDLIIIDDICDGGATFINIAKETRRLYGTKFKLYLIITHGIFSKGYKELSKYFDGIYTTNSYGYLRTEDASEEKIAKKLIKQLDIF